MNTTDRTGTAVTNILTVDVEDWYMDTDISTWGLYEDRIVESTNKIIKLLNESNTKATFLYRVMLQSTFRNWLRESGMKIMK